MKSIERKIVKEIKAEMGLDERVIGLVANYPLKFSHSKMAAGDTRPVRIRYFCTFMPKQSFINEKEKESKEA
jgi:hypothetical protein